MKITINTSNAAFHITDPDKSEILDSIVTASELRRIFNNICQKIESECAVSGKILDSNGNEVGEWDMNDK